MKKLLMITVIITFLFAGCTPAKATTETVSFTDDLGRIVTLPKTIERIAASGHPSQMLLFSIAPEKMVGWARRPSNSQSKYIEKAYMDLPEFGAFYSKKGNLNMEALIAASPQVVIDFGERKENIKEDLNRLQKKLGIPVVFIEGDIDVMGKSYRTLGTLLNKPKRAEALATYCERVIDDATLKSSKIKSKKRLYYGSGNQGLEAIAAGNIHGRVIEIIGAENVAIIENTKGSGGNIIDSEQLLNWTPDIIILNGENAFKHASKNDVFQRLNTPVYQVPEALYNWMGRPPSINQLLGIYWLGNLVYPEQYDIDLTEEIITFYSLFFNYDMTKEEVEALLKNSK